VNVCSHFTCAHICSLCLDKPLQSTVDVNESINGWYCLSQSDFTCPTTEVWTYTDVFSHLQQSSERFHMITNKPNGRLIINNVHTAMHTNSRVSEELSICLKLQSDVKILHSDIWRNLAWSWPGYEIPKDHIFSAGHFVVMGITISH